MDTKQTNRVTMYKTTARVLDQNNSVWSAMAPLATAVQEFKDELRAIDEAAQRQETPTTGAAVDKVSARDELEEVLFLTCEGLGVLGTLANDNDLVALTALTPAVIHKFGVEELANRAATVLEKANAMKTELATLQITQANLDEFAQALQDFNQVKEKPRHVAASRVVETATLASLIRDANGILRNKIDRLVNLFRRSHPKFVASYCSARVIVDRPASHASPQQEPVASPPETNP